MKRTELTVLEWVYGYVVWNGKASKVDERALLRRAFLCHVFPSRACQTKASRLSLLLYVHVTKYMKTHNTNAKSMPLL